jgi:hypothetical protein
MDYERKVRKIFQEIDLDSTGRISREEFKEFMIKEIKSSTYKEFEKKANELFNSADLNKNNYIEFEEFYNIMLNSKNNSDFNQHDVYQNWVQFSLKPQVHPLIFEKNDQSAYKIMISNISGTLVSRFLLSPLERIKILNQVEVFLGKEMNKTIPNYSKNIRFATKIIIEQEGFRGLFKGNFTNMLRVVPHVFTRFYTFYHCDSFIRRNITQNYIASSLVAGGVSSAAALASTYPLEVLRTRLAVQIDPENKKYDSLMDAIKRIKLNEGYYGFFRGFNTALLVILQ